MPLEWARQRARGVVRALGTACWIGFAVVPVRGTEAQGESFVCGVTAGMQSRIAPPVPQVASVQPSGLNRSRDIASHRGPLSALDFTLTRLADVKR
jgi:hypothetical protein